MSRELASQRAQLEQLAAEKAAVESALRKKLLHEKGEEARQGLQRALLLRALSEWRAATAASKEREAAIRERLGRCRIDVVARGTPHGGLPGTSPLSNGGSSSGCVVGKRRRTAGSPATHTPEPLLAPEPLPTHLPLRDIIVPELCAALAKAGLGLGGSSGAVTATAGRQAGPGLLYKIVLCTGTLEPQSAGYAAPSATHLAAAEWLRTKLSAGRTLGGFKPATGERGDSLVLVCFQVGWLLVNLYAAYPSPDSLPCTT